MNENDFRELVRRMRKFQQDYFKYRDRQTLERAKAAERAVDEALVAPGLFDDEGGSLHR